MTESPIKWQANDAVLVGTRVQRVVAVTDEGHPVVRKVVPNTSVPNLTEWHIYPSGQKVVGFFQRRWHGIGWKFVPDTGKGD